jgi:hypothetical protein
MLDHVARLPFPSIKNAWLFLSGRHRYDDANGCAAVVSFVYIDGDIAAEWEPHGPIQLWFKSTKDSPGAVENYVFPWVNGSAHWSQLAVEYEQLPQRFIDGEYDLIFAVLRRWVESRWVESQKRERASLPSTEGR